MMPEAKELAERLLRRAPVPPLTLPADDPLRLLAELCEEQHPVDCDCLECWDRRDDSERHGAIIASLERDIEDLHEWICSVARGLGLECGNTMDATRRAIDERIRQLRGG